MSYPNNPPEGPYGQGQQPGQDSGGYPSQHGQPTGGQPGYQQGGYPPPHGQPGGHPGQSGGYPGQGGYEQTGGYQAPYQQGGYGQPPHGAYGPSSATTGQPSADERQMAMFAHVGGGILSWIVPLILFLVKKDESPFVRDQAAQALNFQLLVMIGYVISSVLMIVFIGFLTWFVCWVAAVALGIIGGVAANRGEWYRYPFNVSWIK
ncbi:hypothetical protein CQJ94_04310 [Glycomyces fuscus]|nr:hypothetical protein CQJ94_04310 [Glycomyces fuscus]